MTHRRILWLLLPALLLTAAGCSFFAKAPMDVLYYTKTEPPRNPNLIIFMRGMGGSYRSFASEGLVDDVRRRGLPFDMVAPDAHFGYYSSRTLIVRLREDVILPARAQGYQNIWLVGFSMGGLGSLLYIREHPEDIQGVCLISPFLGYEHTIDVIAKAGGVTAWQPDPYDPVDDWEPMLWDWIRTQTLAGGIHPPVYLGYGLEDDYVKAQNLLAEVLPPSRVFTVEGSHNYDTFKRLWREFLARRPWEDAGIPGGSKQP
jgi:pimeloyl-ACP methyl ester carboxylesterase